MKLPLPITASLRTSCEQLRPVRRLTLNHGGTVYKALRVGRTYLVEEGCVRLILIDKDGHTNFCHLISTGGIFGDLPFVPITSKQVEHAVVSGSASLLEMSRVALETEAERNHEFNLILLKAYGTFLSFRERRLQWQLTSPLIRRTALALTDLLYFGAEPCPHGPGYMISIRMTQEDFAELLGVARQTLNAILKEWKEQNVVSYTRSCFCIRNPEMLQRIAS